jgi:hypothetical protein
VTVEDREGDRSRFQARGPDATEALTLQRPDRLDL